MHLPRMAAKRAAVEAWRLSKRGSLRGHYGTNHVTKITEVSEPSQVIEEINRGERI
jgi:hypothetical protein